MLTLLSLSSNSYSMYIENNAPKLLGDKTYIFITHPSSYWDFKKETKKSIKELVSVGKDHGIKIIGAFDEKFRNPFSLKSWKKASGYYISSSDVDVYLESSGGQHEVNFSNTEKLFFAGGNLNLCLCESIRDAVRNYNSKKTLKIFLIVDAIYGSGMWYGYNELAEENNHRYIDDVLIPSFSCDQNSLRKSDLNLDDTKLDVFFNGQFLISYDLEPDNDIQLAEIHTNIELHYIKLSELKNYLD